MKCMESEQIRSDHGQSGGATFKQRYGKSLEEVVQELAKGKMVQAVAAAGEGPLSRIWTWAVHGYVIDDRWGE